MRSIFFGGTPPVAGFRSVDFHEAQHQPKSLLQLHVGHAAASTRTPRERLAAQPPRKRRRERGRGAGGVGDWWRSKVLASAV
jgi:hypothetical protein